MICGIHQPNYLPWIGYIHKISLCDVFVFYDTTQYTKWDFRNRNAVKWANGKIQLTLPVSFKLWERISDVSFDPRALKKHFQTITQSYSKAPYYSENRNFLEKIYSCESDNLSQYCTQMITQICNHLDIKTKFITLSQTDINLQTTSTQALVDICKYFGADTYIVWGDAWYMQNELFVDAHITLQRQNFIHPEYSQLWWDFMPYLSIIDVLLNEGIENTKTIISCVSSGELDL